MAYRPPEKWTYEACLEESKKYKTRTEFKKGCVGTYDKSCKQKWIDDFTWLASPSNKKYTYEEVKAIAEQFDSLAEFTKQFSSPYEVAKTNDRAARILRKCGMMGILFPKSDSSALF